MIIKEAVISVVFCASTHDDTVALFSLQYVLAEELANCKLITKMKVFF